MSEKIHIVHDDSFDIAFSNNAGRNTKNWRNKKYSWSELVNRVSETHRTVETHAEYIAAAKARQAEIKDVGGFVGGYLTGGRRKPGAVLHRQLITLDLDYSNFDFWADFELQYYCAAAMYSTHKHSIDAPRYRLVIPMDREVKADEYEAIARKIAGKINIELFDITTFQPERLMYWPSTSKDGQYIFEYQDAPFLKADDVLAEYTDWTDSSEWPVSARVNKIMRRNMVKQGDPLEKPGVVGAWCRTYTISEVIAEHLSDVYDECDVEDRFTYKEGSAGAGLIVYDEKYAYSHHGTDPISGKLCNAFDMVRIHKFGLKDEDAKDGTPSNKLPSYLAMLDFASKQDKVRVMAATERLQQAHEDFKDVFDLPGFNDDEPINLEWTKQLEADRNNKYYSTINNIVLILENDPAFRNNIAYDDFEKRAIVRRKLPWREITHETRYLTDMDDANIEHYIESVYGLACTKLEKAFNVIYERHKFHPVRDFLNGCKWDRRPRLDRLFIDYMGAEDNAFIKAATRKSLVACVARVFQPGIKFDYMVTFIGKEGRGKSTLIDKLGGKWYSDSITTVQGKEAYEQLQGVWIAEMAELAGIRNAEVESVKHFISKRVDRYRVAYGHRVENFPRQCVPFGSTNKRNFMRGYTGNRRFWPVDIYEGEPVKNIFVDLTESEISQIWAEAVYYYSKGEPLYLTKEIEALAFEAQEFHTEGDERRGLIERYINTPVPKGWEKMDTHARRMFLSGDELLKGEVLRDRISAAEIYCELLGGFQKDLTGQNTKFIHDIMRTIDGWKEFKARTEFGTYGNQKGYFRADSLRYKHMAGVNKLLESSKN